MLTDLTHPRWDGSWDRETMWRITDTNIQSTQDSSTGVPGKKNNNVALCVGKD